MSEPASVASGLFELVPGVVHWTVHDDRIGFRSEAYAISGPTGWVAIDPLPLAREARGGLRPIVAIVCGARSHQRSAWSFREATGADVWVPTGCDGLEGIPQRRFRPGDPLPFGIRAIATPGPLGPHVALLADLTVRGEPYRAAFVGDLVMRSDHGPFGFLPDAHVDDAESARRSLATLVALGPDGVFPAHGAPLAHGASESLAELASRPVVFSPDRA